MADVTDDADKIILREQEEALKRNAVIVASIPKGVPGECEYCGEHFSRLVGGACGRCRDYHKLG